MRRVEKVAKKLGISKNALLENAIMERVLDFEQRQALALKEKQEQSKDEAPRVNNPSGLGITSLFQSVLPQSPVPKATTPTMANLGAETPTPAPVVVQVSGNSNSNDVVNYLATYVLAADDLERTARMRTCIAIVSANCKTPEEKQVMCARLDEALAIVRKKNSGILGNTFLRQSFDKLTNMIKGHDE